ncbi:MAG TPA: TIGR01906 family membrane protein [Anaerolineales bacterium]|nr:TIGR01906 family membrane protein [Anaerolineales bacterium]
MTTDVEDTNAAAAPASHHRVLTGVLSWIVALAIPMALIGLAVRVVLLPAFIQVEYHVPGLPPDDYGFTTQERVHWAGYAWNYLVNSSDISYLGNLRFPDGKPLFNERELSHMEDVKHVVQGTFRAWYISLAVLAVLGIWAWRAGQMRMYLRGLKRGGWLTIAFAALIGTIVAIGILIDPDVFWNFFAWFHSLFFQGNSWIFEFSDTLIRLFPIRFWEDTFLLAALIILAGGAGLAFGVRVPSEPAA